MIELVMYGMIPSAKTANWVSAPPENRWRKPSTPPWLGLLLERLDGVESRCPGTGTWDPSR